MGLCKPAAFLGQLDIWANRELAYRRKLVWAGQFPFFIGLYLSIAGLFNFAFTLGIIILIAAVSLFGAVFAVFQITAWVILFTKLTEEKVVPKILRLAADWAAKKAAK